MTLILLGTLFPSSYAAVTTVQSKLLNNNAGLPENPKNIKLSITLPESYSNTEFVATDLAVYIYPQALNPATGRKNKYRAENILLWQHDNQLFLDIRRPPRQRSGGDYTVYLELSKDNRPIYTSELTEKIEYNQNQTDVVLIIDNSLSMHSNDPYRNRLRAAKAFVDIARNSPGIKHIGIISFNNKPKTVAKLTPVRNSRRLHAAIDSLEASGQTDIGAALEAGLDLLDFAQSKRCAVVLLTDGKNESSTYNNQHKFFGTRAIPVYCVGLSNQADIQLLRQISEETDGAFYQAVSDNDLLGIYQRIASVISSREIIFTKKIPYNRHKITVPVDASLKDISFMLNAGMSEAVFGLVSPEGEKFEVIPVKDANFSEINVPNPDPGLWTVIIGNRSSKRELELNITGTTEFYLDAFPPLVTANKIWLSSTLAKDGQAVGNANIQVLSKRGRIKLYDDGKHGDGQAEDGVYTCTIPLEHELDLDLLLRAWGSEEYPYIRQADAGTVKKQLLSQEELDIDYTLSTDQDLDFGSVFAGKGSATELNLNYTGLPDTLKADFSALTNSVYTINAENLLLSDNKLESGDNLLELKLHIPEDIPAGEYTGTVKLSTEHTAVTIPLKVEVCNQNLRLSSNRIDLGQITTTKPSASSFNAVLTAPQAANISLTPLDSAIELHYNPERSLIPGETEIIEFSIVPKDPNASGEQTHTVLVRVGALSEKLELTYQLPAPAGREQHDLFIAHELSTPQVGRRIAALSIIHENSLPIPVEPPLTVIPVQPQPQKALKRVEPEIAVELDTKLPELATPITQTEDNTCFMVILILILTLALSTILLLLRRLSNKRMIRFALLSAALHLPIIAVIASYVIVSNTSYEITNIKPEIKSITVTNTVITESYLEQNSSSLQHLNTTAAADTPMLTSSVNSSDLPATKMLESEANVSTQLISEEFATSQTNRELLPITALHTDLVEPTGDVEFKLSKLSEINKDTSANRPELQRTEIQELQANSTPKPELCLDAIFAAAAETASTNSEIDNNTSTTQNAEPTELSADASTFEHKIKTLLNNNETEHNLQEIVEQNNFITETKELLSTIEPQEISENPTYAAAPLRDSKKLQRDLGHEIAETAHLRTISKQTPALENPELLLTSIDNIAPIEKTKDAEDLLSTPDTLAKFSKLAQNQDELNIPDTASIISEAAPKPTLTPSNIDAGIELIQTATPKLSADTLLSELDTPRSYHEISRIPTDTESPLPQITSLAPELPIAAQAPLPAKEKSLAVAPDITNDVLENDNSIQSIDLPLESYPDTPDDLKTTPDVIALIDELDIDINHKIARTIKPEPQQFPTKVDITRENQRSSTDTLSEQYIPLQPDIAQLISTDTPEIAPETPIEPELPTTNLNDLDLGLDNPDLHEMNREELNISRIAPAQEDTVKIIGSPQRLDPALQPSSALLKFPQTFQAEKTGATDSNINGISVNIGILSDKRNPALATDIAKLHSIHTINLNNSSQLESDILACQLIICDKESFNTAEINLLRDYITSGGYLWVQDNGIPGELTTIGKITPINNQDRIFSAIYNINKNQILFAEELRVNSMRRIIATGCRNPQTESSLLINIFNTVFGSSVADFQSEQNTAQTYPSYIWQNFSGVDKSTLGWKGPNWGNTLHTTITPDSPDGEALMVDIAAGSEDITSINYIIPDHEGRRIDLSGNSAIILDIYNASKKIVELSLGLTTEDSTIGWDEFETGRVPLHAGWNKEVIIPLQNFRSRRDPVGGYTHSLQAADNCARVSLYFSNIRDGGNFLLDNIKWAQ